MKYKEYSGKIRKYKTIEDFTFKVPEDIKWISDTSSIWGNSPINEYKNYWTFIPIIFDYTELLDNINLQVYKVGKYIFIAINNCKIENLPLTDCNNTYKDFIFNPSKIQLFVINEEYHNISCILRCTNQMENPQSCKIIGTYLWNNGVARAFSPSIMEHTEYNLFNVLRNMAIINYNSQLMENFCNGVHKQISSYFFTGIIDLSLLTFHRNKESHEKLKISNFDNLSTEISEQLKHDLEELDFKSLSNKDSEQFKQYLQIITDLKNFYKYFKTLGTVYSSYPLLYDETNPCN